MQTIYGREGTGQYNAAEILFEEYRKAMGIDMGVETKIDTVH